MTSFAPLLLFSLLVLLLAAVTSEATEWSCSLPAVAVDQVGSDEGGLSEHEVENHLRSATAYVDPRSVHWSCIDAETTEPQLGTPGGDSGEFIVGLAVYERQMQKYDPTAALDRDLVRGLFDEYLGTINRDRRWYLHSDQPTLAKLRAALNNSTFDPSIPVAANQQEAALELLMQPDYVGCPHIRLMMLNPDEYQVRTEIVQWYLAAFYDFMWNHEVSSKFRITDYEVVEGTHDERALVRIFPNYVRVDDLSHCMAKAPLIAPTTSEDSMFIYHEGFVNVGVRNDLATFFAKKLSISFYTVIEQMNELVAKQLVLTASAVGEADATYVAELVIDEPDAWEPPPVNAALVVVSLILTGGFFVAVVATIVVGLRRRREMEAFEV